MREHTLVHYYVIRRLIHYPLYEKAPGADRGGIVAVMENRHAARKMLRDLELQAFRSVPVSLLEQLTCDHAGGYWGRCFDLVEYCRREFELEIADEQHSRAPYENDRLVPRPGAQLPEEITDDQIWQIKRLTGIDFYELFDYQGRKSDWEDFVRLLERDVSDTDEKEERGGDAYAHRYR